jgi:hypothetical protein
MFRSSVATFYALLRPLFYRCGGDLNCSRSHTLFLRRHVRSEVEKIIHRMAEILFAPEIAFRSLDRCMPEQKLNLLKLTATAVT